MSFKDPDKEEKLESNNTNKTKIQEVGCTGNGNEDTSKPSNQRNKMSNGISEKGLVSLTKIQLKTVLVEGAIPL